MRDRRWYARPWIYVGLGALLVTAWLARSLLLGPLVASLTAGMLADATGGRATVRQASGGWLTNARLAGVEISDGGAEPAWRVAIGSLQAQYDPALLGGELGALRSVTVEDLQAEILLDHQSPGPSAWPPVFAQLPAELPHLQVRGEVVVRSGEAETRLAGMQCALTSDRLALSVAGLTLAGRTLELPACVLLRSAPDAFRLQAPMQLAVPGITTPLWIDTLRLTLGREVQELVASGRLAGGTWQATSSASGTRCNLQAVNLVQLGLVPAAMGHLTVDAVIEQQSEGWRLSDLRLSAPGVRVQASAHLLRAPWRCADLLAEVVVDLAQLPGQHAVAGELRGRVAGLAELQPERWRQSDLRLELAGRSLAWADVPAAPLDLVLQLHDGQIEVASLSAVWDGLELALMPEATVQAVPDADGWRLVCPPLRCAGGVLQVSATVAPDGVLNGELRLEGLPLAGLPGLRLLRYAQGTVSGRLLLSGSLRQPRLQGELGLAGLEVKVSPDVPTFSAGQARLAYADGALRIVDLHGDLGGSTLHVTGKADRDGLDLVCSGSNLLLVQRSDARLRADVELRLGGTLEEPRLAGNVRVVSALFTPEVNVGGAGGGDRLVLFELADPPWSRMRFDLTIGSLQADPGGDAGVRVATRWGRGSCDLDLHLGGTGAAPEPRGRVAVRAGVVTLPFSTLQITHGELVFPPGEPFRPQIHAIAGARIRRYDVQLQVSGPLDEPVVRVSGSGLDEQEAMLLLTTGSTPRELQDEHGQRAAIGRIGTWLGHETWRNLAGPDDPDAGPSLFDRVTIEWGREVTAQGRDTIDSEVELTMPGSSPGVLLYGERDRYDQYNAGILLRMYWGGEEP